MLNILARRLLADLNYAGAVLGAGGEVLEVNDAFRACFFDPGANGPSALCREVQAFLQQPDTGISRHAPAEAAVIHRKGKPYRLDVYYLDKSSGQDGLRLVIATPVQRDSGLLDIDPDGSQGRTLKLSPRFAALIGRDPSFVQALMLAQRAAQTDLPVLILGESGTGKEILARTIHQASRRQKKPFVDVNCAAVPDSLVESELFGYEKGAFTGASTKGKAGYFESAHQGTIFMDEIGDAAPQTQAKLLRVLESGQFKRIGSNRNISVDVRLIAATNQELNHRIAAGRFRADLLYRINTISIRLLPLRERIDDLPLLAEHFLKSAARGGQLRFSREAMELLRSYAWPGNVRELKGVVDYAVTMTTGKVMTPRSFPGFLRTASAHNDPLAPGERPPPPATRHNDSEPDTDLLTTVLERTEKRHIQKILEKSHNRSEAIRRLGISRRTFYAKIRQYGLE